MKSLRDFSGAFRSWLKLGRNFEILVTSVVEDSFMNENPGLIDGHIHEQIMTFPLVTLSQTDPDKETSIRLDSCSFDLLTWQSSTPFMNPMSTRGKRNDASGD